jgi:hypothetical protein
MAKRNKQSEITTVQDDDTQIDCQGMAGWCPNCEQVKPMKDFGFRRMKKGGVIRKQAWCKACRGTKK